MLADMLAEKSAAEVSPRSNRELDLMRDKQLIDG